MKLIQKFFSTLFIANIAVIFFLIWQSLNFLQIDLAGHIASSVQFTRNLMHGFSDRMFLGYTHSLFYPPLEDFMIAAVRWISQNNPFDAYRIYLMLLIGIYFLTIWRVGKSLKSTFAFTFFCLATLYLLNIEKPELVDLQGMSVVDLFITGLSNQFLAGICLFAICKELIEPSRYQKRILIAACIGAILSHIVVSVVCFMLVVFYFVQIESKKQTAKTVAIIIGLSSFYAIPFLTNGSYLVSSNIFRFQPWAAFVITSVGLGFYYRDKVANVFLAASVILLSTVTLISKFEFLSAHFPKFHYYRFTIIAFYLSIIGLSVGLSRLNVIGVKKSSRHWFGLALCASFLIYIIIAFNLQKVDVHWPSLQRTYVDFRSVGDLHTKEYGRYLTFGKDRSCDTGIDSILSIQYPEFRSSKGLFWESSYTNTVQSSYLATLLSPPVVLDYFYYYGYSCPVQKCLMDQYFRMFNVNGFIGNMDYLNYIKSPQKECYKQIVNEGTNYFSFHQTGDLKVNSDVYPIYKTEPKPGATIPPSYSNEGVEIIQPSHMQVLTTNKDHFHREVMEKAFKDCNQSFETSFTPIFLLPTEASHLEELKRLYPVPDVAPAQHVGISLQKIDDDEYIFDLPPRTTWFLVKLAPQPGMRILNEEGDVVPTLKGMPYTYGIGQGKMRIVFARTWKFWLGYLVTLGTIAWLFYAWFVSRTRTRA